MSQSYKGTAISKLPDVTSESSKNITRDIYCMVLSMNIPSTGPFRMFVTDFTRNKHIANPRIKNHCFGDEAEVPIDQIFQVEVYREKWHSFRQEYESTFGEQLIEAGTKSPYRIAEKFCIVKAQIGVKKYGGVLEGRLKHARLVRKDDMDNELVRNLLCKIRSLPSSFRSLVGEKAQKLFPGLSLECDDTKQFNSLKEESNFGESESESESGQEMNDNGSPFGRAHSLNHASETLVKNEDFNDGYVPDTQFENDYLNSPQRRGSEDEDELSFFSTREIEKRGLFEISQLNDLLFVDSKIDGRIYRTKGRVIGSVPSDWSHLCVKGYGLEEENVVVNDPFLRGLEVLISEQEFTTRQADTILDQQKCVSIHLDKQQLFEIFDTPHVETIYTNLFDLNKKLYNNLEQVFELYKKGIPFGARGLLTVWSARNISLGQILQL